MRSILFGIFKYISWALAVIICLYFLSDELTMTHKAGIMLLCIVVLDILFNLDAFILRIVKKQRRKTAEDEKQRLSQAVRDATAAKKDAITAQKEAAAANKRAEKAQKENERLKSKGKGEKSAPPEKPESKKAPDTSEPPVLQGVVENAPKAIGDGGFMDKVKKSAGEFWLSIKEGFSSDDDGDKA